MEDKGTDTHDLEVHRTALGPFSSEENAAMGAKKRICDLIDREHGEYRCVVVKLDSIASLGALGVKYGGYMVKGSARNYRMPIPYATFQRVRKEREERKEG